MMPHARSATVCGIYLACAAAITIVAGCATVGSSGSQTISASGVVQPIVQPTVLTAKQRALLERRTQRETELLARPQTAESAAELALLHHPAVERALETLDMPGFDRLLLAHTVNPAFNGGSLPSTMDTRIERSLSVNLMTWVSVPALSTNYAADQRAPRVQAADELVAMLFDARRAWVYAVASRQSVRYLEDVLAAAEAGRDIVQSMREVGNSTELEFLRAQAVYADAVAHLTAAQVAAAVEKRAPGSGDGALGRRSGSCSTA